MDNDSILASDVKAENRVRQDFGNLDSLANSIRENGLIQPIVVTRVNGDIVLVAGERRLRALKKLGLKDLVHAIHFVWKGELNEYQIRACEYEENLRRQNLSWQEEVIAKKKLLETYQAIYGPARDGRAASQPGVTGSPSGFGINKLASLLGESNATTSKDIELANLIEQVPQLARAESKEAARRQATLVVAVALSLQKVQQQPQQSGESKWKLYEGDFYANAYNVQDASVDFVCTDPPYGIEDSSQAANSRELLTPFYLDPANTAFDRWDKIAKESFRVLKPDSFGAFFFDFDFYPYMVEMFRRAGFTVDTTPVVWYKNTVINTSPYTRYGRAYEPILIVRKGNPKLSRFVGRKDVIEVQNVVARSSQEQKVYHTQKPVELIELLILDMSLPDSTVIDWCAGSGTTGVASVKNSRKAVMFEIDTVACNIIKGRMAGL